jgi:hypothetical protein
MIKKERTQYQNALFLTVLINTFKDVREYNEGRTNSTAICTATMYRGNAGCLE